MSNKNIFGPKQRQNPQKQIERQELQIKKMLIKNYKNRRSKCSIT